MNDFTSWYAALFCVFAVIAHLAVDKLITLVARLFSALDDKAEEVFGRSSS